MAKKLDTLDQAVEEAIAYFSPQWTKLSAEERETAENVTVLTVHVGGRKAAAEAMGVGATTLDNYRSGKTQPKYLELIRLARAAQAIHKEALTTLRTLKPVSDPKAESAGASVSVDQASFAQLVEKVDRMSKEIGTMRQSLEPQPSPPATMKYYPHAASAGWGQAVIDDEGAEDLDMEHFVVRVLGLNIDFTNLVPVKGESMYPTLQGGDYAIIDRRKRKIVEDELFVFSLENDLYIKRAKPREDGSLCWISDNPDYPPICLQGDEMSRMKVVGRVTNVIRAL